MSVLAASVVFVVGTLLTGVAITFAFWLAKEGRDQ